MDCEGFGLCCFNGCFNRCLEDDKCKNVTKTECVETPSEVCEGGSRRGGPPRRFRSRSFIRSCDLRFFLDVSKHACNPMVLLVSVPVSTEVCATSEKVCASKMSEVCQDFGSEKCAVETFEECSDVAVPFNATVSEQVAILRWESKEWGTD